ncbi:cellulase family glycosylhydrolase [Patescibacteria group bacterium]
MRFIWIPIVVIVVGGAIVFWSIYGKGSYPEPQPEFGVTFSTKYCTELGLDWKEVYIQTLDDLGVRLLRIPVYWDEIEKEQGVYQLADVRWMLDEAAKRDAEVILAIGRRVPRWPECHPPLWTKPLSEEDIQEAELLMLESVVYEFIGHPVVKSWQVQNEPLFSVFGECPQPDEAFITSTINLVRELDPDRPIMVTDSGELSTWVRTAGLADVLGISMYRVTWNSFWGYFYYPLPPSHYSKKAEIIAPLVDDVVVTELQVEPWVPSTILTTQLDEQYRSMNVKRFENNIDYVRRTGFSEVYLWGVEWWYWLHQMQNDTTMWNAGRKLFQEEFMP